MARSQERVRLEKRLAPFAAERLARDFVLVIEIQWCRKRDSNPRPVITNDVLYQLSYCGDASALASTALPISGGAAVCNHAPAVLQP